MFDRSEQSFPLSFFPFCHTHGAYTQNRMPYLITELSPHIPLLAVTTLALSFVVNSVWFSASVTVTYYLFFDFLIGHGAFASLLLLIPTLSPSS
jgi:hypothetical protein